MANKKKIETENTTVLRVPNFPEDLHSAIKGQAAQNKMSLQNYVISILQEKVGKKIIKEKGVLDYYTDDDIKELARRVKDQMQKEEGEGA